MISADGTTAEVEQQAAPALDVPIAKAPISTRVDYQQGNHLSLAFLYGLKNTKMSINAYVRSIMAQQGMLIPDDEVQGAYEQVPVDDRHATFLSYLSEGEGDRGGD